ncbi:MAG: DNA gyrase C-terminal beta-propeller domain-containing protein, partial [Verrucomicrobiota bacterium]
IKIIRESKNRDEARERLAAYHFPVATAESLGILIRSQAAIEGERYVFSERQVNAILELRLYQLTGMERDKVKGEYDSILVDIKDLLDILAREERVLTIIKDELRAIKDKHATPRKCPILAEAGEVAMEELIANDAMIVTLSHRGYVKRTPASEYRLQGRGGKGLKGMETRATGKDEPDDFIEHLFSVQAHDYLMFFTNTGRVYVERVYELPEGARTAMGRSIRNVLNLKPEEKIAALLRLERTVDESGNDITFREGAGFVFFATRTGKVKKTALNDFRNYRKDGIIAIILEQSNELIGVRLTSGSDEIVLVTHQGLSLRFHEDDTRSMGRASAGVMGIRPVEGDYVVGLALVTQGCTLLVASENGLGKRTDFEEYRRQSRGGKGIITMKVTDKTGPVVGAVTVTNDDELMLMTSTGQSIRIRVAEIRETGRNAMGVKLLTLKEGENLQDISLVIPDGEDAEGLADSLSEDVAEGTSEGTSVDMTADVTEDAS